MVQVLTQYDNSVFIPLQSSLLVFNLDSMASGSCSPISLSSRTFCILSTELWAVPQLSCSHNLGLQHGSRFTFTFALDSCRSSHADTGSHLALGQLTSPLSSLVLWYKTSQLLFSTAVVTAFSSVRNAFYRLPVIGARNQCINLCLARILSIAIIIPRTFQVVLNRSSLLLRLTLLTCSGISTVISCSVFIALASSHLTASTALTNIIFTFWV